MQYSLTLSPFLLIVGYIDNHKVQEFKYLRLMCPVLLYLGGRNGSKLSGGGGGRGGGGDQL